MIKEFTEGSFRAEIRYSDYSEDPREWGQDSIMMCGSTRYNLGDRQLTGNFKNLAQEVNWEIHQEYQDEFTQFSMKFSHEEREAHDVWAEVMDSGYDYERQEVEETSTLLAKFIEEHVVVLPLMMYEHSNIHIYVGETGCRWDSGRLGVIFKIIDEGEGETRQTVEEILHGEVEIYDQYVSGEVYSFLIFDDVGDCVDSCSGFYDLDQCENETKSRLKECSEEHQNQLESEKQALISQFGFALSYTERRA